VLVPPTVKVPQFMELKGMVHAALENTPKFAEVDIAPDEAKVVDVVTAEKVVSTEAIPIMTNATAATVIESLRFSVIINSAESFLYVSACYCAFEYHRYCFSSCVFSFFSFPQF